MSTETRRKIGRRVTGTAGILPAFVIMLLLAICFAMIMPFHPASIFAAAPPTKPNYVVTIHPLAEILKSLCGSRANVTQLLPSGASPHTYEPRPADAAASEAATALFYGSPLLDAWATNLPTAKKIEIITLVPNPLPFTPDADDDHAHASSSTPPIDPHFWTDPNTTLQMLPALQAKLTELDPSGAEAYAKNAAHFAAELKTLDAELSATLAPIRGKSVMLFHPSFCYMLKRYGLIYAGSLEAQPGKEATPKYLQRIIGELGDKKIKAIFTEPQLPPRPAEVVAEAAHVTLHELDPNGGRPGRMTYAELMKYNAKTLAEALK